MILLPPNWHNPIDNQKTGAGAHGIVFSKDGKSAYVSNQSAGSVSVINVENRSVTKTLTVGDKPNGMAIR